jgi:hypothetical protein
MTVMVLSLQVALPLALIAWVALSPGRTRSSFGLQAAGTGAFLFALARVAQWAVPVWWLPWVYGGLWLLAVMAGLGRRRRAAPPSVLNGLVGWVGIALSFVLLCVGGWYGARAVMGRSLPEVEIVDIGNPLGPGHYLVGNGGSNRLVNVHIATLDRSVARFGPWRGQSYALDFFGLGPWGLRARGWRPADPAAYAIFGAELRAPCAGTVIATEGEMPDFEVPNSDQVNRLGNHVILRCGEAEIVLAHMRQSSVIVASCDPVRVGDLLGQVGNSGASTEPHLHIHAQRPVALGAPPVSGAPLALRIERRFLVRGDHLSGQPVNPLR